MPDKKDIKWIFTSRSEAYYWPNLDERGRRSLQDYTDLRLPIGTVSELIKKIEEHIPPIKVKELERLELTAQSYWAKENRYTSDTKKKIIIALFNRGHSELTKDLCEEAGVSLDWHRKLAKLKLCSPDFYRKNTKEFHG